MRYLCRSLLVLSVLVSFWTTSVQAAPMGYTDQASFLAALPGPASVLNFDSMGAEAIIADGDTVEGITFTYDFDGVQMMVSNLWDTTSPDNFLGTDDADIFQGGDGFELAFAPSNAIGMYFISADSPDEQILDGDITLMAGGLSVGLDVSVYDILADGSYAFFLGIIDDDNFFTTASITSFTDEYGPYFFYNVDDITTAAAAPVPEPSTLLLIGTGLVGLTYTRRRRR